MQTELIKLPPLPADASTKSVELVWLFAKMQREDQRKVRDILKDMTEGNKAEQGAEELASLLEENAGMEASPDVTEFAELLKSFIGELMAEACEMAGAVYQLYCMEGKSLAETAREMRVDEDTLQRMTKYYDLKNTDSEKGN